MSETLNERIGRVLAATAYGIRRQSWGDSLLIQAFGDGDEPSEDDVLDTLEEIARRCGLAHFDAHTAS